MRGTLAFHLNHHALTITVPSMASVGDARRGPKFSLIHGIKVCVDVSATDLLVKSETAMMVSFELAIK